MVEIKKEQTIAGKELRIIAGKYVGKTGWYNASEKWGWTEGDEAEPNAPVIVQLGRGKGFKCTVIKKASFREVNPHFEPDSYAEAVIDQRPDIEKNLVTVTRQMAKCKAKDDIDGFDMVMHNALMEAIDWQNRKGTKADYFTEIKFEKNMKLDDDCD